MVIRCVRLVGDHFDVFSYEIYQESLFFLNRRRCILDVGRSSSSISYASTSRNMASEGESQLHWTNGFGVTFGKKRPSPRLAWPDATKFHQHGILDVKLRRLIKGKINIV